MKYAKIVKIATIYLFPVLLTSCGAMVKESHPVDNSSDDAATSQNTISLLPPLGSALPEYTVTGDFITDMAGWLNAVRETVGLPPLALHNNIQQSAQNHADYQVANKTNGHYEMPGLPDFTGEKPGERVSAVYSTELVGEVNLYYTGNGVIAQPSGDQAIQMLIDAPFHRILMLSNFGVMGVGYGTDYKSLDQLVHTGFNVDFADNVQTLADNLLVAYPYTGQTEVPVSWYAKEEPNPFRNLMRYIGKIVGYPVTIQGALTDKLVISSFTIETDGANVPCHEVDSSTPIIGKYLHTAAICVPYKPYNPNTQYTATVTGKKNDQSFTVTWSWTTAALADFRLLASKPDNFVFKSDPTATIPMMASNVALAAIPVMVSTAGSAVKFDAAAAVPLASSSAALAVIPATASTADSAVKFDTAAATPLASSSGTLVATSHTAASTGSVAQFDAVATIPVASSSAPEAVLAMTSASKSDDVIFKADPTATVPMATSSATFAAISATIFADSVSEFDFAAIGPLAISSVAHAAAHATASTDSAQEYSDSAIKSDD
jgi:uncharacterized protein YkwD